MSSSFFSGMTGGQAAASLIAAIVLLYLLVPQITSYRRDVRIAKQLGAKRPQWIIPRKLPFGIEIVVKGFRAARQKRLLDFLTEYFDQTGPTVQIELLGGKGFATMQPENVEALLSTKFDNFELGSRSLGFRALVGEGIFTQDGQAWKHSRELLRHRFAKMQYQDFEGFREQADYLIETLRSSHGVVDLQPHFYRMTLDTTIAMILGQPVANFRQETGEIFGKAFSYATLVTATRVRLGPNYWLFAPRGFFEACTTVRKYTADFVETALRQRNQNNATKQSTSFIHDLDDEYHDPSLVRDQVLNILLAGRDTTATTISYAFRFLVRHPEVLQKLRREIEIIVGTKSHVTRADIQQMSYLRNVVNETLRLRPPVPLNTRFCRRTTTIPLGGGEDGKSPMLIRQGESVAYSVFHMHRRKDIYGEDALQFRPERWDEPKMAGIGWAFLPFNGGPRVCLGKDFGLMLASYGIVRMLQAFPDIQLPPGEKMGSPEGEAQNVGLVLSTPEGCKVILGREGGHVEEL